MVLLSGDVSCVVVENLKRFNVELADDVEMARSRVARPRRNTEGSVNVHTELSGYVNRSPP
jgi:hypothetical protein